MTAGLLLALGASLAWGVADFVGPWQGRTLGALRVMFWGQVGAVAVLALVMAARGGGPHDWHVLWAVPASVSGILGLFAYYRGVQTGAIAVVAPIAGASAIVPVIFGIATGDHPRAVQFGGIGCAIVGVALASREHQQGERRVAAGVGLALLAAIGFGFYFPPMHAAGAADPWWASFLFRLTALALVGAVCAIKRPELRVHGVKLAIVIAVGLGDTLGNYLFAEASARHGLVSVTSVLASLYPIVTVLLAAFVLKERVARFQMFGIGLTLAGIGLISA